MPAFADIDFYTDPGIHDDPHPYFHFLRDGARGIEGMEDAVADALLQEVWDEAMRVIRPYHHHWRPTDILIWDNWRVLHEASGCPVGENRVMHRTTIQGDYGLGRFEDKPQLRPTD